MKLDSRDNIAIVTKLVQAGQSVTRDDSDEAIVVRAEIPPGHKIALDSMPAGTDVLRYGEVIGATTVDVVIGDHVHVHNLISKRIPGRAL